MQLFQVWAESITLLKPQNLKLFLLVTLKSIVETYTILCKKFWAIAVAPLIIGMMLILGEQFLGYTFFVAWGLDILLFVALIVGLFLWYFVVFLCARPSTGIKNWQYAIGYWKQGLYFCIVCLLYPFVYMGIIYFLHDVMRLSFTSIWVLNDIFFKIYGVLFVAFLLDSDGCLQSVYLSAIRALKMLVFNLPFIIISLIPFALFNMGLDYFYYYWRVSTVGVAPLWQDFPIYYLVLLLLPIPVCFYINFYVKKVHEQFNLYFPVKDN